MSRRKHAKVRLLGQSGACACACVCVRERARAYRLGEIRTPRPSSSQHIDHWTRFGRRFGAAALDRDSGPHGPSNIQLAKVMGSSGRFRRWPRSGGGGPGRAGKAALGPEPQSSGVGTAKRRAGRVGSVFQLRLKHVQVASREAAERTGSASWPDFQSKSPARTGAPRAFIVKGGTSIRPGSPRRPDAAPGSGFSGETHIYSGCVSKRDVEQSTSNICRQTSRRSREAARAFAAVAGLNWSNSPSGPGSAHLEGPDQPALIICLLAPVRLLRTPKTIFQKQLVTPRNYRCPRASK